MNVQAEIITIGDEILIGQTVDTNTAWMGQKLNASGVDIDRVTSIRDTREAILETLTALKSSTKLVLITGGLGPTKDDLTKHVLLEYFGGELVLNQKALDNVHEIFNSLGLEVTPVNRDQALLPSSCTPLINKMGTASGMLFKKGDVYIISMPGVPYEMKYIMTEHVLPMVQREMVTGHIIHKTILVHGIGESMLADMISDWEENLPPKLKLAYLPSPGLVKLRITARGGDKAELEQLITENNERLQPIIKSYVFGNDDDSLEKLIGSLLIEKGATLSTAESCTGGNVAYRITTIPGSSAYFTGSIVAYDNEIKKQFLDVSEETLQKEGAVSEAVVREMAEGIRKKYNTQYSIATSGVAGPGGGTEEKPVGTVWIAASGPGGTYAKKFLFGNDRSRNIKKSTFAALNILRVMLLK